MLFDKIRILIYNYKGDIMLFASSNLGKVQDVSEILKCQVLSLKDIDKEIIIEETGKTFLDNAILKAKEVYKITNIPTLADDSGLEIPALNGFPGVLTHRFLGADKTDSERNQAILKMVEGHDRTCYFICSVAFFDGINLVTYEYRLKGSIAKKEKFGNGFGFDSIFLYKGKYLSDMTLEEKNNISPRKKALLKLKQNKIFKKNVDLMH